VVPPHEPAAEVEHAERFLSAGAKTMALLGVRARIAVRRGDIIEEVAKETGSGHYSWIVLGTPLAKDDGRIELYGLPANLLREGPSLPILFVRSQISAPRWVLP
jgi:hypothetical protein